MSDEERRECKCNCIRKTLVSALCLIMSYTRLPIESPYGETLDRWFGSQDTFYEYNPGQCIMPACFSNYIQDIFDAEVRKDDVWLVSYPRAGSTWCQEMVWLIGNELNFEAASSAIQQIRAPMIELSAYFPEHDFCKLIGNSVEFVKNKASPRFIKSHLPYELLPKQLDTLKPKIIYVARNPKDLCISYYFHMQSLHNMQASFEEVADLFCKGKVPMGSIWNHYLPFWNKRAESNILFLKYEDMKLRTKDTIRQISDFLNKTLTEDQVECLYDFLSFENMRDNPGLNMKTFIDKCNKLGHENNGQKFIRNGKIGDWKNYMSPITSKKFDDWIQENTKATDLNFM